MTVNFHYPAQLEPVPLLDSSTTLYTLKELEYTHKNVGLTLNVLIVSGNLSLKCSYDVLPVIVFQ